MWSAVEDLLYEGVEANLFSGCALCVRNLDEELFIAARGLQERVPQQRIATLDTVWDIASITKILCTAHLYLKATADGRLHPDTLLQDYFPQAPPDIHLEHLLSHSSGYPAWRPFYAAYIKNLPEWSSGINKEAIYHRALNAKIEAMPMTQHRYSDIGFILLGAVLEAEYQRPLDELWATLLPFEATRGLSWGAIEAAATEDCPIRKKVIRGEVHDLNSASLGGISGHAGLFGDVSSVAAAAAWPLRALHGRNQDLPKELVEYFWRYRGAGTHCLGWDTPSAIGSSASDLWPAYGVGHLGFTGCSVWLAIEEGIIVTFLSNRIHPTVEGGAVPNAPIHPRHKAFKKFRPTLHRYIWNILHGRSPQR